MTMRLKPYYNFISEVKLEAKEPCPKCEGLERVEQCFVEFGHGWLPDDYQYVTKCVCECENDN